MAPLLKDQLFNRDTLTELAEGFERAGVFAAAPFVDAVVPKLAPLELKARIAMIADVLAGFLPADFPAAADAIEAALPPPLDPALRDDDFGKFIYATLGAYVENHGLEDHSSRALDAIEAITQRFSMEFSIRAFLNRWPDQTLERMQDWAGHGHYHVRRLVSEGTRPKLPWGQGIGIGPDRTLPLLDKLHVDPTRFVTRSVANHLNDITKSDPDVVLVHLESWQKARRQDGKELDWMRRHTLRGLIKAGHPGAMAHLGFDADVPLADAQIAIAPADISIGDAGQISLSVTTTCDAPLIIDYVIDFVKSNGSTAPKVFKIKQLQVKADVVSTLQKNHVFKAGATTFTHYPGAHRIHLQVNGRKVAQADFTLS